MKVLMLLGGIIGLTIGFAFGFSQRSPWPDTLWRAAAASLAAGLMFRWWGRVWIKSLRAAQQAHSVTPASNSPGVQSAETRNPKPK